MYVRLAFAVAAHLEPEILIVDEVLAVGDAEFQKKCLGKMGEVASGGRTVLFVSHNMAAVGALCHHGLVLDKGTLTANTSMEAAMAIYALRSVNSKATALNVLFEAERKSKNGEGAVTKLEILDKDHSPTSSAQSGAPIIFRIWFAVDMSIPQGSVILCLRGASGETIAKFETNPNHFQPLLIPGIHYVDCCVGCLSLMPGQYFVSLALALHGVKAIDWNTDVATVVVRPSGDPELEMSVCPEGALVLKHRWSGDANGSIVQMQSNCEEVRI
jgi:lipopolysaccharide transport system ATP-binding protein